MPGNIHFSFYLEMQQSVKQLLPERKDVTGIKLSAVYPQHNGILGW